MVTPIDAQNGRFSREMACTCASEQPTGQTRHTVQCPDESERERGRETLDQHTSQHTASLPLCLREDEVVHVQEQINAAPAALNAARRGVMHRHEAQPTAGATLELERIESDRSA